MDLKKFMKGNKEIKEDIEFVVTESLKDDEDNPIPWTLTHISSTKMEAIRDSCTFEEQVPGKIGQTRSVLNDTKFNRQLVCAAVVVPNLRDAELQDSYGVKTPEDLLLEMVDDPGEYTRLLLKITEMNGFDKSISDKVDEAKNL